MTRWGHRPDGWYLRKQDTRLDGIEERPALAQFPIPDRLLVAIGGNAVPYLSDVVHLTVIQNLQDRSLEDHLVGESDRGRVP